MKLFLDTADLKQIKEIASWGILDGVTTNPTLLAKEGKVDAKKHLQAICELVDGPVSMEVFAEDSKEMVKQGLEYSTWADNIVVKIPMTPEGLKAVVELKKKGIPTNVTLIFSANQALLAAKAGAAMVSPFIGRLDEAGEDGLTLIQEITDIFSNYAFDTEVLVASVRGPRHITEAARMGAHIATLPYEIFKKLPYHPLTTIGLEKFLADWNNRK
jgi:transaldolase